MQQADGLLTSREEVVDGRHRRRYRPRNMGPSVLAQTRQALREFLEEVLE